MTFDPASMRLDGKRTLVTGGASGIGAAIAEAMALAGADVAVTYRSRAPDEVGARVAATGRRFHAIAYDLAEIGEDRAEALIGGAAEALGGLDILVNNAGLIHRAPAVDHAFDEWRAVLSVALDTAFLLSRAAGRRMVKQGSGRIISMASVLSFQGGILVPSYAAAKHGLVGLTRALCNEWAGDGVTVNALAPGYIETEMTAQVRSDEARADGLLRRIPAGTWGTPDDVAAAAVFIASDAARYINGHTLAIDGGWLAR